jgi:pectate lyase-like protein
MAKLKLGILMSSIVLSTCILTSVVRVNKNVRVEVPATGAYPTVAPTSSADNRQNVSGEQIFTSVKSYGAKGDAVTDDTAAIQATLDAVCKLGGHGDIFFPPGAYSYTQPSQEHLPAFTIPKTCSALHLIGGNEGSFSAAQFQTQPSAVLLPRCDHANAYPAFLLQSGRGTATQGGSRTTLENLSIYGCNQAVWLYGVTQIVLRNTSLGVYQTGHADNVPLKITNSFWIWLYGGTLQKSGNGDPVLLIDSEKSLSDEQPVSGLITVRDTVLNGGNIVYDQRVAPSAEPGNFLFEGVQAEMGGSSVAMFKTQCEAGCAGAIGPWTLINVGNNDNNSGTPLVNFSGFRRFLDVTIINSNGSATRSPAIQLDPQSNILNCRILGGAVASRTVVRPNGASAAGCVTANFQGDDYTTEGMFPGGNTFATTYLDQNGFFGGNVGSAIRMARAGDTNTSLAVDANAGLLQGPGGASSSGYDTRVYRNGSLSEAIALAQIVAPSDLSVSLLGGGRLKPGIAYSYFVETTTKQGNCESQYLTGPSPTVSAKPTADKREVRIEWPSVARANGSGFCVWRRAETSTEIDGYFYVDKSSNYFVDLGSPAAPGKPSIVNNTFPARPQYVFDLEGLSLSGKLGGSVRLAVPSVTSSNTATLPADTGTLAYVNPYYCGTTSRCSSLEQSKLKVFYGSARLIPGNPSEVTISGFSPGFRSIDSYVCTVSDATAANPLRIINSSVSSIRIIGPNHSTDEVTYDCKGI